MKRYKGIIPPLVTPLAGRDQLDRPGFERLIERVIAGGVHRIFILGTTGEAPSLSYRLRREVIERACRQVDGRVPVLVGITDTSSVESVHLAEFAGAHGAAALVLTTPYYFPAGQTELIAYIEDLMPRLPLPLLLYNMPSMTKIWFEIGTLKHLSTLEGIVGMKDSSSDIWINVVIMNMSGHNCIHFLDGKRIYNYGDSPQIRWQIPSTGHPANLKILSFFVRGLLFCRPPPSYPEIHCKISVPRSLNP